MKVTLIRQSPKYGAFKIIFDHEDAAKVLPHTWTLKTDEHRHYVHARMNDSKTRQLLHRWILNNPSTTVDHINGNGLDNRRCNLRVCSTKQNTGNTRRSKANTSGYKGVHFNKRQQKYQVRCGGIYIGVFSCKHEAARTYDEAAKKHFGRFAKLNFS